MPHCQALASSLDKSLLGDFATKLQQYGKLYKVKILTFWGSKKSSNFAAKKEFNDNGDNYLLTTIETTFRGNQYSCRDEDNLNQQHKQHYLTTFPLGNNTPQRRGEMI